jgi:DNA repair photolyase
MLKWKHPLGIITKNSLVLRDLDLLKEMASMNLVSVHISITSLSEDTRRLLEPRTSSIKNRLKAVEVLSENNIPVCVMMAPIIPSLNSHEILPLVKKVSELGALDVGYTMVRLNGKIAEIFKDWAYKTIPDRAERILNQIAESHGGTLNDSRFGSRMRGQGAIARQVRDTMALAKKKYFKNKEIYTLDRSHYLKLKDPQMRLF